DRPSAGATLDRSPRRPPPGPLRPSNRALTRRLSRAPAEKREEVSTTEALRREELTAEDAEDAEKREHRGEEEELHHGGTEGAEKKRALRREELTAEDAEDAEKREHRGEESDSPRRGGSTEVERTTKFWLPRPRPRPRPRLCLCSRI